MTDKTDFKNSITVIQTAKDTDDRLTSKSDIFFETDTAEGTGQVEKISTVEFNREKKFQQIIGFGGAFTEAGGWTLSKLSFEKRNEVINAYFYPETGLGYTLCRTHINSCDFSLGSYSYDDTEGDIELNNFTIEKDKEYLIPFIKEAMKLSRGKIRLFASPWSPPSWMKTNGRMTEGGKLKEEYRKTWALFFSKYIKAYEKEGIPVWGVTVQNEPLETQTWESCLYTAEEERDFVRDYLGPLFQKDNLGDKKIIIWDLNMNLIYERAKEILSDKEAAKYIWGIGFHWYSGEEFENLAKTHEDFPDKKLIFTEGTMVGGVKLGAWDRGEQYGRHIIGDMNNWTVGWVDWNMVLDSTGGPNHVGNFCDAPVIADIQNDKVYYQNSFYYIGHFSKYVKPDAFRIQCESICEQLETTAFENPDGTVVVVVMNRSDNEYNFKLKMGNKSAKTVSLPHSINTFIYE